MSRTTQETEFDDLYRSTRSDVLLETFLLTGDLTAATSSVKEAYSVTWQHWSKVQKRKASGEEPLSFIRPLAWRVAQRRHTGRIWHRNKGLTEDHRLVLDAVDKLTGGQRRMLLLVDMAGLDLYDAARELAVTPIEADDRLRQARAAITASLGPSYAERLRSLAEPAAAAKLPRTTVVLRAGRERRRFHTVGAVLGAIALTLAVGAAAREPGLERASGIHQVLPGSSPVGARLPDGVTLTTPEQLLAGEQLTPLTPKQIWAVTRTDNNTRGDGINTICQETRFADPRGLAALVRTFKTTAKPTAAGLQTVEISRNEQAAKRAYRTAVGWFAGCTSTPVKLTAAHRVVGVGDQAELLTVQVAGRRATTYAVAVARVGAITTMLVTRSPGAAPVDPQVLAVTIGDAVSKVCPSDRQPCTLSPRAVAVPPPPSGEEPGFVATVDLPTVGTIREPWVGVASVNALRRPDLTTRCDNANFRKAGATEARSRTFLIPQAKVPDTFGLTETYAVFKSPAAARAFLRGVRDDVAGCEDRDMTTSVSGGPLHKALGQDGSAWRFDIKVSDEVTVSFRVGFVRVGQKVARVTFVPAGKADMAPATFEALVSRAGERLGELSVE